MYNKRVLQTAVKELDKAKAPTKQKDIIYDPMGQWKFPGQATRIPSNNITMKGVDYPVLAVPNKGSKSMMQPGQDYTFPGADYVDEFPQMKKGGEVMELDLTPEEIEEYIKGGYIIEDVSVPSLTKAQYAGATPFAHPNAAATEVLFQKPAPVKPNSKYDPKAPKDYQSRLTPEVSSTTKVVTTEKKLPKKQTPLEDLSEQKTQADYLVQQGKAARYLGDKYYDQKGDPKELTELMLREIQRNPNILKDIDENEYKLFLAKDKELRNKQNLAYTVANNVSSFMADPIVTGAGWLQGKGAMMDQGTALHDPTNPNYENYKRATEADSYINQGANVFNPGAWAADARVATQQGDYLGAGLSIADAFGAGKVGSYAVDIVAALNKAKKLAKRKGLKNPTREQLLDLIPEVETPSRSISENDELSQLYEDKAVRDLRGETVTNQLSDPWDDMDDDINPFGGIEENDLAAMFARLETPDEALNLIPAPDDLFLPELNVPPRAFSNDIAQGLRDSRDLLSQEANDLKKYFPGDNIPEDIRTRLSTIDSEVTRINDQLDQNRLQRILDLSNPETNIGDLTNFRRPQISNIPQDDLITNPFSNLNPGSTAAGIVPRTSRNISNIVIPNTNTTVAEALATHTNPLNAVNDVRRFVQDDIISLRTARDLMDNLRGEIRNMPLPPKEKKFFIKEAKRISNVPKDIPYSGSTKSEDDILSYFEKIPQEERESILESYGYTMDNLNQFADRYANSDTLMSVAQNQIYDDVRYLREHGIPNPNLPAIDFNNGTLSKALEKETELFNTGLPKEKVKKIEQNMYDFSKQNTTGQVNYSYVDEPIIHTVTNTKVIPKTEELDELISSFEEAIDKLENGKLKSDLTTQLEDYKATKWIRTEYAKELKSQGLNPNKIEGASIVSNSANQKNLIDKDGNVIGTLNASLSKTNEGEQGFQIASTGVNQKFHPYQVGKEYSKFKTWDEAEEYLEKLGLQERLLLAGDDVKANPISLKQFKREAKENAKNTIKQLKENNNNKFGEALYRGVHHGVKNTKGPVFTAQHFAPTYLKDPVTGENLQRFRAKDYWTSQSKQLNEEGLAKAEFIKPLANPIVDNAGVNVYGSNNADTHIIIRRAEGGNIDKLNKFIH